MRFLRFLRLLRLLRLYDIGRTEFMNEITRQIRQIKWVEIIRECNSSGIPKNQWMAEHGINSKSFYRYQKILREHFGRDYLYGKSQNGQPNTREVDEWNNNAVALPLQAASCPADDRTSEEPAAIITVGQMTIRISNTISSKLAKAIVGCLRNAE